MQVVAADADTNQIGAEVPATSHAEAVVQVVDGKGNVLASSANLRGLPRVFTFPASRSGTPRAHTVHDIPEHEHGAWRAVGVPAGTPGNPVTVYVALPTESVDHGLAQLTAGLATGVPAVVALLTGVVWLFTGRALRPVDAMRAQTAEITESDLSRRLDVPPADDALGRLATTFNDLLGRLDAATRRQRRFIADAAHELRSPLSTLHTRLEVADRHPESAHWQTLVPALLRETERLNGLVDDLLRLARLDARPRLRTRPVDLDEIVFAEVREVRTRDRSARRRRGTSDRRRGRPRPHRAQPPGQRAAPCRDPDRHQPPYAARTAQLVVADDGPGIPGADRERVFDRFTRMDDARAGDTGGSDLGLAIVRDIVEAHHGTTHIVPRPEHPTP